MVNFIYARKQLIIALTYIR